MGKLTPYPDNILASLVRDGRIPSKESLEEALALLEVSEREILTQYFKLHQSKTAIAKSLDISIATCHRRIQIAMEDLDDLVEREFVAIPDFELPKKKPTRRLKVNEAIPEPCKTCAWPQRIAKDHYYCLVGSCVVRQK